MLDRLLQRAAAAITVTFTDADGTPTDPSPATATVTVTRADGTVLVNAAAATRTGVGAFSYALTTTDTATLDSLTASWVSSLGTRVTQHEIVGGFLFSIAEARTAIADAAYSAAKIREARTYAETELEREVGYALVPRYEHEAFSGQSGLPLRVRPYIRAIRSATVLTPGSTDYVLTSTDRGLLAYNQSGFLSGYAWPSGSRNVIVGYEHGLDVPPPGATRAALALALDYLGTDTSGIDPRAESIVTVDGTIRLRGTGGTFSALGVNEWVAANRLPVVA